MMTVDEVLKALRQAKRAHGGNTLVAVCVDGLDDGGAKSLCVTDAVKDVETPKDGLLHGIRLVLIEASF